MSIQQQPTTYVTYVFEPCPLIEDPYLPLPLPLPGNCECVCAPEPWPWPWFERLGSDVIYDL